MFCATEVIENTSFMALYKHLDNYCAGDTCCC